MLPHLPGWPSFMRQGVQGIDATNEGWMNKLQGSWKKFTDRTTEFNMYRMSYGVVVNWGLSKNISVKALRSALVSDVIS